MRKRLAGEKYRESVKECFSGQADEEGYCTGVEYGHSCSNNGDADCGVDLYCSDKGVCEHARIEGEHCSEKIKCASYLTCAWEDGVNYKCRPYGFHQDGKLLGPGDEEDLCRSKYMNSEYTCERAPSLTHSNLQDYPGSKCIYSHGEEHLSHCWYHQDGKAICRRGNYDLRDEWSLVLSYLEKHPKCHVTLPLSQCDQGRKVFTDEKEWERVWFALSKIHWEHQMEGLNDCMKQYIHPEAFKYQHHINAGSYLSFSVLALISMLLLVL